MPNRGILDGLRPRRWQDYTPEFRCASSSVTAVQPSVGTIANGALQRGRYLYLPDLSLCIADFQISLGSDGTAGTGNYVVGLPVKARRHFFTSDRPLGGGTIARLFQIPEIPVWPSLCDFFSSGFNDPNRDKDRFIQFFCSVQLLGKGVATIPTGTTTVTVTHGLGFAPNASDITITPGNKSTNNPGTINVQSIGATTFVIASQSNPGASGLNVFWKVRAESTGGTPNQFVTEHTPWKWGLFGDNIMGRVMFEPQA